MADDPMVSAAANRLVVGLQDGRIGTLVWWSLDNDKATILIGGRHVRIHKKEIKVVQT